MAQDFSIKANRNLDKSLFGLSKTFEKLSSGLEVNRASDNPGVIQLISQLEANGKARSAIRSNIGDAVSLTNIQDGALAQIQGITERLSELTIQSQNGTLNDSDREALEIEFSGLTQEISRIASSTEFNGKNVFSGSSTTIQSGLGSDPNSQFTIQAIDLSSLASGIQGSSIATQSSAQNSLSAIETFRQGINQAVGTLGAAQSSLSRLGEVNASSKLTEQEALSRIRDVDYAAAEADRVKYTILAQTTLATKAQIDKIQPQVTLSLLS